MRSEQPGYQAASESFQTQLDAEKGDTWEFSTESWKDAVGSMAHFRMFATVHLHFGGVIERCM